MRITISKKEVLEAIKVHNPATLPEIIDSLQKNKMFVSGYLLALEHEGVIKSKEVGTSIIFLVHEKER